MGLASEADAARSLDRGGGESVSLGLYRLADEPATECTSLFVPPASEGRAAGARFMLLTLPCVRESRFNIVSGVVDALSSRTITMRSAS